MQLVYNAAESTSLFKEGDIKVRINPYTFYNNGNQQAEFVHVFGNIMEGRSTAQKAELSTRIIDQLKKLLPNVPIISMNIRDFENETYRNKFL